MGFVMLAFVVAIAAAVLMVVWLAWGARSMSLAARKIGGFWPSDLVVGEDGETGLAVDEGRCKICLMRRSTYGVESRVIPFSQLVSSEVIQEDAVRDAKRSPTSQRKRAAGQFWRWGAGAAVSGRVSDPGVTRETVERIVLRVVVRDTERPTHDVVFLSGDRDKGSNLRLGAALGALWWNRNIALAIRHGQSQPPGPGGSARFRLPRSIVHKSSPQVLKQLRLLAGSTASGPIGSEVENDGA
jgi:hypothetical protein